MPNRIYSALVCFFLLFSILLATDGRVNVFTGDKDTEIYIDETLVGKESLVKYSLQEGSHFLKIKKNSHIVKTQTFVVTADKIETIVLDDFVDYKTNVASRGALDVEAMRVRETRGNFAFGMHGGSPASGLSLKWFPWEKIGLQVIGYANDFNGNIDDRGGARLIWNFNDSVYQGGTLSYYLAAGAGHSMLRNYAQDQKNERYDLTELAFGLEFKIANFFNQESSSSQHVIINDETSPFSVLITQLILGLGEGFFKTAHFNLELGGERIVIHELSPTTGDPVSLRSAVKFSGGFHIYF